MGEVKQQTLPPADIVATGKRCSLEAARDASELCDLARSLHRLGEPACNYDLTERQKNQAQSWGKSGGAFSNEQV